MFPLLIILTFGIIEYGWMFLKAHQITNAVRNASRLAIRPNATNAQIVTSVSDLMTLANITGYQITFNPADISLVNVGETVGVEVSVPWEEIAIINLPLLPKPATIQASSTMAKEGP